MSKSLSNDARNSRHETKPKTSSHDTTDDLVDFVRARAVRYQQKELARLTGLSLKQVQNLRLGLSGVSGKTLTNWCKNCPTFAGEYAEYVGLIRPGEAEFSGALTKAFNAYQRRKG